MYCLNMLAIALELAGEDAAYEDVATKFFEHFFYIAHAMNDHPAATATTHRPLGRGGRLLLRRAAPAGDGEHHAHARALDGRADSAVRRRDARAGAAGAAARLPRRLEWFLAQPAGPGRQRRLGDTRRARASGGCFAIVTRDRLRRILRADARRDASSCRPTASARSRATTGSTRIRLAVDGDELRGGLRARASRAAGSSAATPTGAGPVWFPLNYLLIEALQKFDYYYGDDFRSSAPTGSGRMLTLWEVATRALAAADPHLPARDDGRRPVFGACERFQTDPHWRDLILFHEYFHGDNGAGLGASHQTGWTALVAKLIQQSA